MNRNIVSVSWGDHLAFGEGNGRLATPDAVARRMERWRQDLGAGLMHWRVLRTRIPGRFRAARGYVHPSKGRTRDITWNEMETVPRLAIEAGLRPYLYVSLFDEGWPLAPARVRRTSYHNAMHGQHVAWQSAFSREHPEYAVIDRGGRQRQWGVLCLAYPEVRAHFVQRFLGWLKNSCFDGLFVCLRSQSRPADFADEYGFNEPVRCDYDARYHRDICTEDFDVDGWRHLSGEYLTCFLRELRQTLGRHALRLGVGAPRGDVIGPPLGNWHLPWRTWIDERLVDHLAINQNSSQCPSMWHELWPMHRGHGYVQNYLDGTGLPPLEAQLSADYLPAIAGKDTRVYVARQWSQRRCDEESALLAHPAVAGLVFSSFRHDNPEAIARADWRA